jgi:hypothetical protein
VSFLGTASEQNKRIQRCDAVKATVVPVRGKNWRIELQNYPPKDDRKAHQTWQTVSTIQVPIKVLTPGFDIGC